MSLAIAIGDRPQMDVCLFCKKELGDGGVVQEDGAVLCLSCDQRTAKAFRKYNPNRPFAGEPREKKSDSKPAAKDGEDSGQ